MNVITVFEKPADGTYKFLTTCELAPIEVVHFEANNGNFLTQKMIYEQAAVSTEVQKIVNNFDNANNNNNNEIQ